jgi:hypothetical protein
MTHLTLAERLAATRRDQELATSGRAPLPGMPVPPAPDFESWLAAVRPAFEAAAATGRAFTTYEIADTHQLPDPPDRAHHWGRLMNLFAAEGWIRPAGWAASDRPTTRHSGVRTWRGTAAARKKAAA